MLSFLACSSFPELLSTGIMRLLSNTSCKVAEMTQNQRFPLFGVLGLGHKKMKQLTIAEASRCTSNQELIVKLRLNVLLPALTGL